MDKGKQIWFLGLAGLITFVLYEVNFVFDVSAAHGTEIPDPVAEAARCAKGIHLRQSCPGGPRLQNVTPATNDYCRRTVTVQYRRA